MEKRNRRRRTKRNRKRSHAVPPKADSLNLNKKAVEHTEKQEISRRRHSHREDRKGYFILGLLGAMVVLLFVAMLTLASRTKDGEVAQGGTSTSQTSSSSEQKDTKDEKVTPTNKSAEAKQAVMEEDAVTMASYGLTYDYANLSLPEVVQAFEADQGIDQSQIAFSYKNIKTNEQFAMNDTQAMTAGSTYKLPLNMLVVDKVDKGELSLDTEYDITNTDYEYQGEHDNYVAAFGGKMTIPQMQEYSLVYSENTPAYALAERLGGMTNFYNSLGKYGQSKGDIKTIQEEGNKTTSDYYIQVLDYLWKHKEKYSDILDYIGQSFPEYYYKAYNPGLTIYQKPGYVREALNVDAVVMEQTPYLIAIYTRYLGGSTEESSDISNWGLQQLEMLCYVINEWHRVNMN